MELSKVNFSLGSDAKILDETLWTFMDTPQYPNKPEFELEELQELKILFYQIIKIRLFCQIINFSLQL